MSAILDNIKALAAQAAETGPDMTESVKGGGGARLLPEGYAFGRLVEYIEFGKHPQEFQGKAKDPAMEIQLGFALWGEAMDEKGEVIGTYHNEDGSPYIIRPYPMAMSRNEKARAFLLFQAMNWKGNATHFAQLLAEPFLVKIVHEEKSKTDKTLVSRVDLKGFLPPLDPVSKRPYNIPAARDEDFRIFLWDYPTLEMWDALYVDGKFDDGRSKNFLQEQILSALDFSGSALEALLISNGKPIPKVEKVAAPAKPAAPAPAAPSAPGNENPAGDAAAPSQEASDSTPGSPSVKPAGKKSGTTSTTTSPSKPAMPAMPAMPA